MTLSISNNASNKVWTKFWSLKFSLLGASILGDYYSTRMKEQMGKGFPNVIIVSKKGYSSCFFRSQEKKEFGVYQTAKYVKEGNISEFCKFLNHKTTNILSTIKSLIEKKEISDKEFIEFVDIIHEYTGYYTVPRLIIDSIDFSMHNIIFDDLKKARLFAEPVYSLIGQVINKFTQQISDKTSYGANFLSCMTIKELKNYLNFEKLPEKDVLEKRFEGCWLVFDKTGCICIIDKEQISKLEKIHIKSQDETLVSGDVAFRGDNGKVKSTARVVFDPLKVDNFNEGDVLITGMTRPDFLPLMKKAAAIVTDCGGLLCHAAIVARELGKPTIIGTKNATAVFKDGDIIEVDADKGIIRLIKRKIN